jgi:hypothetical protein
MSFLSGALFLTGSVQICVQTLKAKLLLTLDDERITGEAARFYQECSSIEGMINPVQVGAHGFCHCTMDSAKAQKKGVQAANI